MAAGKKSAKNNKTAHVLNLLTGPGTATDGVPAPIPAASPTQEASQPAPSRPLTPPILEVARSNDEQISDQIRMALEDEFPIESAAEEVTMEILEEHSPVEAMTDVVEAVSEVAEVIAPEETVVVPNATAEESPLFPSSPDEEILYFNVIQALVEEKAPRYIQMFGLCSCSRCATDVKALALNHLEPKYVTMRQSDRIPMLTVYESRYGAAIFAQLTQACKVVMDHPRHDEGESHLG